VCGERADRGALGARLSHTRSGAAMGSGDKLSHTRSGAAMGSGDKRCEGGGVGRAGGGQIQIRSSS
jgi:hypothetical protein